jgi:Protein of unknown function (DUF2868)
MNANALRSILLVKNVEEQDPDGAVLPLAERAAATRDALRQRTPHPGDTQAHAWAVLADRASLLQARLAERHPVVTRALELESGLAVAGWLMLPAAFALGLLLSLYDSRVRIEILAFPLLGVVVWNLVVYALLLVSSVSARRAPAAGRSYRVPPWLLWPARWGWQRAARLIKQSGFYHRPLAAALRRFSGEWWPVAQPLLALQGQRLFHLGSAAVATGLIAGFYLRGIALEYRAGWESTFLAAEQVRILLGWIYGPAAVVTGIGLPADTAATSALHWRNGQGGGPAALWIHLMSVTALLYVIVPRLLLAVLASVRLGRTAASLAPPEALLTYARGILGGSNAALPAQFARLTAFACEPGAASERGVQKLLRAAFGSETRIEFAPTLRYGDEAALAASAGGPKVDIEVWLFNMASTPEVENHGEVLRLAGKRAASSAAAARVVVLVDEAPYLARLGGDASLAGQIEQRRAAWRDFVRAHGFDACLVDLAAVAVDAPVAAADVECVQRVCRIRAS